MPQTVRQLTQAELQQFDPTRNLANGLDADRWTRAQARLPKLLAVLRTQFGAKRIMLFGSLTSQDEFTHWSDIDLAAWGIAPEQFYDAVAALNDLSPDIKVDLVDPDRYRSAVLKQLIETEGKEV